VSCELISNPSRRDALEKIADVSDLRIVRMPTVTFHLAHHKVEYKCGGYPIIRIYFDVFMFYEILCVCVQIDFRILGNAVVMLLS
jgi:hypothetical protein